MKLIRSLLAIVLFVGSLTVSFGQEFRGPGFSQSTSIVPTLNNGLTLAPACATCSSLLNPFPTGVPEPPGASAGLSTFLGRSITFTPLDRRNALSERWEFNVQHSLPGDWMVEASYIGSRAIDVSASTNILDAIPRKYLSTSPVRDDVTNNFLQAIVANPFQNLIPGQTLNGSTTTRSQLLRPAPQFTGISSERYDGSSIYHAAQFRAERRFSRGFSLLTNYTWSKEIEKTSFLNDSDTQYERRIYENDTPHRAVVSGIWELPFGRGRLFGKDWNGIVDAIFGGWQAQGIFQWQSGRPFDIGNRYYNGDPRKLKADISGSTVDATFDTSGFYFTDAAVQTNGVVDPVKQRADARKTLVSNIRTMPSRMTNLRGQPLNQWDLSVIKNFAVAEKMKFQLRGEFLNAFNHAQFANPTTDPANSNFAKTTSQSNLPRNVQIGLKLTF